MSAIQPPTQNCSRLSANKLTEYKFDVKQLVRDICNSQTYQRTTQTNETNAQDTRNYAFAQIRRIPAEMLLDCISEVTNTKDKFRGLPEGARAVQIADGSTSTYFLTAFGRSPRTTVCEAEASTDPSLSQALHLLNGSTTQGKIAQGGLVKQWLAEGLDIPKVLEHVFVRSLARHPTPHEVESLTKLVGEAANRAGRLGRCLLGRAE